MKLGLVGKPSAGKSTFFKAATLMNVDIANYPFTTIEPNAGFAHVRVNDPAVQFGKTSNPRTGWVDEGQRFVPFELIDVAGLVPGAHEGKGRGLSFLSDLNEADALIHVIDCSGSVNAEGEDVEPGSYDPRKDVEFLHKELDYWYLNILRKGWEKLSRRIQQEKMDPQRVLAEQLSGLRVTEDHVKSAFSELGLSENLTEWKDEELLKLATYLRERSKPIAIAANKIDKKHSKENFEKLKSTYPELITIPCSAEIELALREADKHKMIHYRPGDDKFKIINEEEMNEKQRKAIHWMETYMQEHGTTGVQQVMNAAVFDLLKYKAIFPGGVKKLEDSEGRVIPDCWLVPEDTTAFEFAGIIHTDFQKHYIKAVNVKSKLPIKKDEPLNHMDVVEIVSAK